jgi:hypothetical protein
MDAGRRIATQFPALNRNDWIQLVKAFRTLLISPRSRGRKRSKEITAAYLDWKAGMHWLALCRKHIPGFEGMSHNKRQAKSRALRDAIRSRRWRT